MSDSIDPNEMDGPTAIAPRDPMLGRVLDGKYEIEHELGSGGMGAVYSGRHIPLDSPVAIKVLHPQLLSDSRPDTLKRFINEAKVSARLNHPNIIKSFDIGQTDEGAPYFVLELLQGRSLESLLGKGQMALPRALHIVNEILKGLEAAHQAGVVHRDIKPENVFLIDPDAARPAIKLLDFGIAKIAAATLATAAGSALGTPYYMSPEQFKDASTVDQRTDIYSVGVMLYELLAGQCPFVGETLMDIFMAAIQHKHPPLGELRPDVPPGLVHVIERAFAVEIEDRFASAFEFRAQLERYLDAIERAVHGTSGHSMTLAPKDFANKVEPPKD